ncbi:ATP-binding cassette domain-containing protein [Actinomyces lilanjuaniae]|uniref:ATP-binding cassette domain-containing protein n=1 Tax=Actinomyces lilanjuaniae TaxID=2321394 RepID=A0ABN5PMI8_9ACTO|nr:ATP-binding cassette domain-containing protein [Actinomyces lilanjuaniae]AYD89426.1 ATP-binding cassette domain-containing protein [Actinomyces lilanjuaniae]
MALRGRVLGLLGPNGAGKITLLSIAGCVLAPALGRVAVMGERVSDTATARRARGSIGFLPQNPSWVPSFTCRETLSTQPG